MMVSTRGRYALQIMTELALQEDSYPVSLRDIAERREISMKYLEAIVAMLVKAGFVESFRGKTGGYRLSRAAEDYTIRQILELTEGTLAPVACVGGGCPKSNECITAPMWQKLDAIIAEYLDSITLKDLSEGKIK